jgi:hypothetical protein
VCARHRRVVPATPGAGGCDPPSAPRRRGLVRRPGAGRAGRSAFPSPDRRPPTAGRGLRLSQSHGQRDGPPRRVPVCLSGRHHGPGFGRAERKRALWPLPDGWVHQGGDVSCDLASLEGNSKRSGQHLVDAQDRRRAQSLVSESCSLGQSRRVGSRATGTCTALSTISSADRPAAAARFCSQGRCRQVAEHHFGIGPRRPGVMASPHQLHADAAARRSRSVATRGASAEAGSMGAVDLAARRCRSRCWPRLRRAGWLLFPILPSMRMTLQNPSQRIRNPTVQEVYELVR